jgi:hypothetical protein
MATFFSGAKGRVNLATPEGGSIWQVHSAGFLEKESKAIEKKSKACIVFCRPVILHHIDTVYE